MDLNAEFDRRLAKIDMLKDFIVLYGKKKENIGSLQQLQTTANRCEELMQQCVHCVQQFQQINKDRFEQMMEKVEYTQRVMMNIMEEMDKKDEVMAKENNSSVSKNKLFGEQNLTARKESTTPLRTVNRVSKCASISTIWHFCLFTIFVVVGRISICQDEKCQIGDIRTTTNNFFFFLINLLFVSFINRIWRPRAVWPTI